MMHDLAQQAVALCNSYSSACKWKRFSESPGKCFCLEPEVPAEVAAKNIGLGKKVSMPAICEKPYFFALLGTIDNNLFRKDTGGLQFKVDWRFPRAREQEKEEKNMESVTQSDLKASFAKPCTTWTARKQFVFVSLGPPLSRPGGLPSWGLVGVWRTKQTFELGFLHGTVPRFVLNWYVRAGGGPSPTNHRKLSTWATPE